MRRLLVLVGVALSLCAAAGASPASAADPVVMAAGDVACNSTGTTTPRPVQPDVHLEPHAHPAQLRRGAGRRSWRSGDLQYPSGGLADFRKYFDPSWGRLGSLLRPAPGNHEYQTSGASGYFDYFAGLGVPTGKRGEGWYSFDIGSWHFVSLNSSNGCSPVKCSAGSPQETWLRNDLAATTQPCILAYWHHPLSTVAGLKPLWQDLHDAGADFVLVGHTHTYSKPKAMNADRRRPIPAAPARSSSAPAERAAASTASSSSRCTPTAWTGGSSARARPTPARATCHGTPRPTARHGADRELRRVHLRPERHLPRHVDRRRADELAVGLR